MKRQAVDFFEFHDKIFILKIHLKFNYFILDITFVRLAITFLYNSTPFQNWTQIFILLRLQSRSKLADNARTGLSYNFYFLCLMTKLKTILESFSKGSIPFCGMKQTKHEIQWLQ